MISLVAAGIACAASLPSCGYSRKAETYGRTAKVMPHFSSISAGILQTRCMPCHGSGDAEEDLSTYQAVLRRVRPYAADSSSLYKAVKSGDMPVYQPMLSDDEILAIYQWIQNGAPND